MNPAQLLHAPSTSLCLQAYRQYAHTKSYSVFQSSCTLGHAMSCSLDAWKSTALTVFHRAAKTIHSRRRKTLTYGPPLWTFRKRQSIGWFVSRWFLPCFQPSEVLGSCALKNLHSSSRAAAVRCTAPGDIRWPCVAIPCLPQVRFDCNLRSLNGLNSRIS